MSAILNPYIPFRNNAREAMEFYHGVFGGNLTLSTFGEYNFDGSNDPAEQDLVMHGMLTGENGLTLMGGRHPVLHAVHGAGGHLDFPQRRR